MKILAIEFSSPQRSVGILQERTGTAPLSLSEVIETGARSTQALGLIADALREAGLEREQVECLAVGLGPGSYTGIRAAIALAQGWQLASGPEGIKLLGIGSVECLAAQARAEGILGRVAVVIDAQRDEFYLAEFELGGTDQRQVEPLRLATLAGVHERQKRGALVLGPEVNKWFPAGRVLFPRAVALGQLAAGRTEFVPGQNLEPIYLRETKFVKAPPPRILPA
jgi:tRNA threonylcarbamoyl adenosine modification protein YeaZ